MTQEEIVKHLGSKKPYYQMSHLLGHKISELRRKLSKALGEFITRSSFKEPLRRKWGVASLRDDLKRNGIEMKIMKYKFD